jgi:predicted  nucleic acid-binding Zn-ribbon protein
LLSLYNPAMSRASSLFTLQSLDQRLDAIALRLQAIEQALGGSERLTVAKQHQDVVQAELVSSRSETHAADQAVESHKEKIARNQQALYGGSVTNPKELEDLQRESRALQAHLQTLEERLLEAMVRLDDTEAAYDAAKAEFELAEADTHAEHRHLIEERDQLTSEGDRLAVEREAALASVGAPELALYDEIKQNVGPMVVALVEDGACSACGLGLPDSQGQTVRRGTELVRCYQCGRILYAG